MKVVIFICILSCGVAAFADLSSQEAYDFAARCADVRHSSDGIKKLEAFIGETGLRTNGRIGWSESFWCSIPGGNVGSDITKLDINRIMLREPDWDDPMQIKLENGGSAKCLVPPEKIAVIYFCNLQKTTRMALVLPLASSQGKVMVCPMVVEDVANESIKLAEKDADTIPMQKNLSSVPGVEITKIAKDDNSYGFPPSNRDGVTNRTFDTAPSGCALRQIVLYAVGDGVWATGLDRLPLGRYRVHCKLLPGESGSVEDKLLKAIASTFDLNIKKVNGYLLNGFQVTPPNPLPESFKVTKEAVGQSQMHGKGDYEGYSLDELFLRVLHGKPFVLLSTNTTERYDVQFDVWPEADGEMAALEQGGFKIVPIKMPKRTLIISSPK